MNLSVDPLWPRAGDWPAPTGENVDVALLGIPTAATSLSGSSAHATPAAVREALRFYTYHAGASSSGLSYAQWPECCQACGRPCERRRSLFFCARIH